MKLNFSYLCNMRLGNDLHLVLAGWGGTLDQRSHRKFTGLYNFCTSSKCGTAVINEASLRSLLAINKGRLRPVEIQNEPKVCTAKIMH